MFTTHSSCESNGGMTKGMWDVRGRCREGVLYYLLSFVFTTYLRYSSALSLLPTAGRTCLWAAAHWVCEKETSHWFVRFRFLIEFVTHWVRDSLKCRWLVDFALTPLYDSLSSWLIECVDQLVRDSLKCRWLVDFALTPLYDSLSSWLIECVAQLVRDSLSSLYWDDPL